MRNYSKVILLVAAAVIAQPVQAEYWTIVPPPLQTLGWTNLGIAADTFEKENREKWAAEEEAEHRKSVKNTQPKSKAAPLNVDALKFTLSSKSRTANFQGYTKRLEQIDPATAKALSAEISAPGFLPSVETALAKYNLDSADVGDVFTVWWITMWEISNGIYAEETDPETVRSTKAQIASSLMQTSEFAQMSDMDKQAVADELLMQAMLFSAAAQGAAADPAVARMLRQNAVTAGQQMGLDMNIFKLTKQGFSLR